MVVLGASGSIGRGAADVLAARYLGYQAQLADVAGATTLNYICLTLLCCCGWLAAGQLLAQNRSQTGELIDLTKFIK